MRPVLRSTILLLLAAFLLACGSVPLVSTPAGPTVTYNPFASLSPTPFEPPTATLTPSPAISPTPTITPTRLPSARPSYVLQAGLDYAGHSLDVDETVVYPNWTGVSLDSLVLAFEPNHWDGCVSLLTVAGPGVAGYSLDGHRLEVRLDPPLSSGGTQDLILHYRLILPFADRYQVFGYNADQVGLVDWYPFVVPYADGWLLHDPGPAGEHLAYEEADFDVTITPTGADLLPALTMAASAPMENGHARLENARTFAISISEGYSQASTTAAGVAVTSYYFPSEQIQGQRVLQEVARAIQTYSDRFGPAPRTSLSIAETDFYDGVEYDGIFFLSRDFYTSDDGTVLNLLIDIAVHETAHQWWFGQVGSDQAREPWLDEALATYSERIFYEANYPGVTAWQAFRVDAFSPSGLVDATIYDFGTARAYTNAVYLRGALFLQALRDRIGDEAFFAFMKDYASKMAGDRATAADFFRILRSHTSADISDLLSEFFQNEH